MIAIVKGGGWKGSRYNQCLVCFIFLLQARLFGIKKEKENKEEEEEKEELFTVKVINLERLEEELDHSTHTSLMK